MFSRRTILVTFACLGSLPALAQSAPAVAQEPKQVVEWIYGEVVKSTKNPSYNFSLLDKKHRGRFTKAYLAAYDAADRRAKRKNDNLIEADPVTNSQDPSVPSFTATLDSMNETKAQVTARFPAPKPSETIRYMFVKEDGQWKIDDFAGMRAMFRAYK